MFAAGYAGDWWVLPVVAAAFVLGIVIRHFRKKNGKD